MLLSTGIELTAFEGAKRVTTKKGIEGIAIPYEGNNFKINPETKTVSVEIFHRENKEESKVQFGYYQANAVFSQERRKIEEAKPKDQRVYPPTLGNSKWRNMNEGDIIPQNSPIVTELFLTSLLGAVHYIEKKCVFIPFRENCVYVSEKTGRAYINITHWPKKTATSDFEVMLAFSEKRDTYEKSQPKELRVYPPYLGTAKFITQAPREVTANTESDDDFDLPDEFKPTQSDELPW